LVFKHAPFDDGDAGRNALRGFCRVFVFAERDVGLEGAGGVGRRGESKGGKDGGDEDFHEAKRTGEMWRG